VTKLGSFAAGFGVCLGLVILLAVVVDTLWIEDGAATISRRTYEVALRHLWVAVLVTVLVCAPVFLLLGHLFLGQKP
jgi:hypothetical protein